MASLRCAMPSWREKLPPKRSEERGSKMELARMDKVFELNPTPKVAKLAQGHDAAPKATMQPQPWP